MAAAAHAQPPDGMDLEIRPDAVQSPDHSPTDEPPLDEEQVRDEARRLLEDALEPVVPLLDPELFDLDEPPVPDEPTIEGGHGAPLHWDERWGHWGLADQIAIGITLASTVAFQIIGPLDEERWLGTPRLDDTFRDAFRIRSQRGQQRARDVSDLTLSLTVSFPFLFDGLVSALWYRRSPEAARELALMSVQTQFITATVQSLANMIGSRRRPYVQECGVTIDPEDEMCSSGARWRSFFSGHTSQAFAGAVTTCVFHARLPLYGGGSREAVPCVAMVALATLTGALRMAGDMHWYTDVLTGALVGTVVGALVPALRMRPQRDGALRVSIVPHGLGLGVVAVY